MLVRLPSLPVCMRSAVLWICHTVTHTHAHEWVKQKRITSNCKQGRHVLTRSTVCYRLSHVHSHLTVQHNSCMKGLSLPDLCCKVLYVFVCLCSLVLILFLTFMLNYFCLLGCFLNMILSFIFVPVAKIN